MLLAIDNHRSNSFVESPFSLCCDGHGNLHTALANNTCRVDDELVGICFGADASSLFCNPLGVLDEFKRPRVANWVSEHRLDRVVKSRTSIGIELVNRDNEAHCNE